MAPWGLCGRKSEVGGMFRISRAPLSDEETEVLQAPFHSSRLAVLILTSLASEILHLMTWGPHFSVLL